MRGVRDVESDIASGQTVAFGARNAVAEIHQMLRGQIIANELMAGTELNQAQLAKALGVSRGPVREALRMLQDEGLVEARPNLRPRVASIHPEEVDSAYAQRILLEVLGVMVTVPTLTAADAKRGAMLAEETIRTRGERGAVHTRAHYEFHRLLVARLPEPLLITCERLFGQTERYRRFYSAHTAHSGTISAAEHRRLAQACEKRDADMAAAALAEHYTRTALHVLAILAPDYEPRAVRAALAFAKR
jgi:DNA-binding GntR family transcriptional regulator